MHPGSLVRLKYPWTLGSNCLGILICKSENNENAWLVLWSIKSSYKIQEHLANSLLELSQDNLDLER